MTGQTANKAQEIFRAGGVERTGPSSYRVTSTSGETYGVWTDPSYCTCPTKELSQGRIDSCSHKAAVDIAIAKRERVKLGAV